MNEIDRRFHETWLGMVQPIEGLVVSIPVLIDAQCMERQPPHVQAKLMELCPPSRVGESSEGYTIASVPRLLQELLGFSPESFDREAVPDELALYVPEGRQTLRPTMALRKLNAPAASESADSTPASRAGARYEMLVWQVPTGLDLDKPETVTGPWDYPAAAKFDRLLRHCRVPIGLLTNDEVVRLVYAPHGESSGAITFRIDDMASVGGRPILDAFVMLLSANQFFGVEVSRALPAILAESRKRQANVTNDLADQVFEALQILLAGFQAAAERDGRDLLDDALARGGDHLYKGLLTVLLRLVFVLYAEDRGLLPIENPVYAAHFSVLALFEQLQRDRDAWPDSMSRRFGAWGRVVTLFRAVYLGVDHGELHMPARRGELFDPHRFPFLEGWGPGGSAPIKEDAARAAVRVPTIDDETVFRVLGKLLLFEGQRLSYRALDVEQIGSVYEGLMGYHVVRVTADSVCMRPDRLWVSPGEVMAVGVAQRVKWLKETVGLAAAQAEKLAAELKGVEGDGGGAGLEALGKFAAGGRGSDPAAVRARVGQLVLQPGTERRRTSSHYTPRSLSAPIVRRTLEPLLAVMGEAPASERVLSLKVCDPAMGSGAFLVEACRFLADHVVAAWTREGVIQGISREHGDPLRWAQRLVAQRCLYGVDKNEAAVELAKLSLWLVTLARDLPFTFVDHALRHGDSLVGLGFEEIRGFHWRVGKQLELFTREVDAALEEAIALRERILELAGSGDPGDQKEKERLLWDARDALDRVRLIADVCVGAFFAKEKDKEREKERERRLELVNAWLRGADAGAEVELRGLQRELRERVPAFHWHVEFPEVFYAERPDPLEDGVVNRAAYMDAFVGNPPFAGKNVIIESGGEGYQTWLLTRFEAAHGNADLCAFFFRRAAELLGANGTVGLIATSTIALGDTRPTGLGWCVESGGVIYDATKKMIWRGEADVVVSVVHLAFGNVARIVSARCALDGVRVTAIDSRLRVGSEREDGSQLSRNEDLCFQGSVVLGMGFVLTPEERAALVSGTARNAERVFPFVGGEEINSQPAETVERYVINFEQMSLDDSAAWPSLLKVVRDTVKPERDSNNRESYRLKWWLFAEARNGLYRALQSRSRCLVNSQVSRHVVFAWRPVGYVFGHTLYVHAVECSTYFAAVQSRLHNCWARLLSSSYGGQGTVLRYRAAEVIGTFPFPEPDPRAVIPALESIGERLYTSRASYMIDNNVGLTITYNRLKDPACTDARILELRALHLEMDREVLSAYDWDDLVPRVPPYCVATEEDKRALETFENEVIDRLFALNAKRAEEERIKGVGVATAGKKGKGAKAGHSAGSGATARKRKMKGAPDSEPGIPGIE